jgi:hypothetical protein
MTQADRNSTTPYAIEVDVAALRRLRMKELGDLRDALGTISSILDAFSCQPRFGGQESGAGDLLTELDYFIRRYEQAVVDAATEAKPPSTREAEDRGWLILSFAADMRDDLSAFAVLAAEAARDNLAVRS